MPCVLWGCAQLVLNSSIHPSLGILPGCSYFHFRSGLFREQKMSSKLHSPQRDVSREAALSGLCIVNFWGLFPQRGGSSPGFSIHIKLWSIKQGRRCFNCRWCFKQMKSCKTAKDVFPEEKKLSRNLASSYEQKSQYFHLTCQNIPFVLNAFLLQSCAVRFCGKCQSLKVHDPDNSLPLKLMRSGGFTKLSRLSCFIQRVAM